MEFEAATTEGLTRMVVSYERIERRIVEKKGR